LYYRPLSSCACAAWPFGKLRALPDTGQTKCHNDTAEIPCPAPGEDFHGQDAQYTTNPRSYTKLDESGNATEYVFRRCRGEN